jgi:hypothetical protein
MLRLLASAFRLDLADVALWEWRLRCFSLEPAKAFVLAASTDIVCSVTVSILNIASVQSAIAAMDCLNEQGHRRTAH